MAKEINEKIVSYIRERPEWFENLILAAAIQDPEFFRRVRSVLCKTIDGKQDEEDFEELLRNPVYLAVADYNTAQLVNTSRKFQPITEKILNALLLNRAANAEDIMENEIPKALELFREAADTDLKRWEPFINMGMVPWIENRKMMKVIRSPYLFGGWTLNDIRQKLQDVADKTNELKDSMQVVRHDFGHFLDHPLDCGMLNETLETNLTDLNKVMGGGFGKKETVLIIAPSSGGKTVLACQLAGHWSMTGYGGIFVTTEQSQPELEVRLVSNFANIPFKYIVRQWKPEELNATYQESYAQMRSKFQKPIRFVDWTVPGQTIMNHLKHEVELYMQDFGEKPDYLILDWIGGALQQEAAGSSDRLRALYKEAITQVIDLSREYEMAGVALAQATAASSINKFPLDHRHIADAKNMVEGVTSLIGLTALYAEGMDEVTDTAQIMWNERQYLCVTKSRKGPGGNVPVKRRYGYQRLENHYG